MVSEKIMRFQGKNMDLNLLAQQIAERLQAEGYKTQSAASPLGTVIQAQKAGILRDIVTADRAFTILIAGQPNDFTINIGIGKWIQNIAVAAIETLFISWLFLAIDVPEMLWTEHVENTIVKEITQIAGNPQIQQSLRPTSPAAPQTVSPAPQPTPQATPQPVTQPASQPQTKAGLCPTCGYQNDANANFCVKCGTKLK